MSDIEDRNELLGKRIERDKNTPAFAAKELLPKDVVCIYKLNSQYTERCRVVFNSTDEIQVETYPINTYSTPETRRFTHKKLDERKFVHIGRIPGFFKGIFCKVDKF